MEEIWKSVPEYEGYYEASNLGRIKSLPRNGTVKYERILKGKLTWDGYLEIALNKKGVKKNIRIHRVIASTWIPNPDKKTQVNHKNFDRLDNKVDNLEWATPKENIIHAYYHGDKLKNSLDKATQMNPYTTKKIKCLTNCKIYNSIDEARKDLKIGCSSSISAVCRGKSRHTKGFEFEYFDEKLKSKFKKLPKSTKCKMVLCENNGKIYKSLTEAAKDLKLKYVGCITGVCKGIYKQYKGYRFKYFEEDYDGNKN